MSRETRDEREAFIAAYGICSTRGRLYGRDQLVHYIMRDRMIRLLHITRAEIDAVLDPIVKREAGTIPARIADSVIGRVLDLRDERARDPDLRAARR